MKIISKRAIQAEFELILQKRCTKKGGKTASL